MLHLNAYFEFAERFMTQGVVLKGYDQIHILAGTYAKVVGGKPADALLSPIQEGEVETTPSLPTEAKAPAAPPMQLPAAARKEGKQAPAQP